MRLTEHSHSLVLEPIEEEAVLLREDGLLLFGGILEGPSPNTRDLREEWLDGLTERATGRRRP